MKHVMLLAVLLSSTAAADVNCRTDFLGGFNCSGDGQQYKVTPDFLGGYRIQDQTYYPQQYGIQPPRQQFTPGLYQNPYKR